MEPTEQDIDVIYRLTANIQETIAEEAEEILNELALLNDEDLAISSSEHFTVSSNIQDASNSESLPLSKK